MNNQDGRSPLQAISLALQGFAIGLVLIFLSLTTLTLFGTTLRCTFLPLAAVFLWPAQASRSWSLVLVFVLGGLYDMLGGGALGIWTLGFLIYFMSIDGGIRSKLTGGQAFVGFFLSLLFVGVLVMALARLSMGQWPDLSGLSLGAFVSLLAFPLIFWGYTALGLIEQSTYRERRL